MDPAPYFSCIAPRIYSGSFQISSSETQHEVEGDNISNGMFPCLSHTDSEVMRCNNKILNPSKSEVGRKIWNSIARLGVVSGVDGISSINLVEDMERRDKLRVKVSKLQLL